MNMTLEERERRAYADGRVDEAGLLALVIDGESDRVDEAEHETRMREEEVRDLEHQLDEKDEEISKLEDKLAEALSA